jgi:multiple sugar transport system substrate-binding protein
LRSRVLARLRVGTVAVLGALSLVLGACGGASTPVASNGGAGGQATATASQQKITITFDNAMASGANAKALDALIQAFEKQYPNIVVKNVALTNYTQLDTKIEAQLAAHQPPSLAQMYNTAADAYMKAGALVPIQQFVDGPDGFSQQDLADFYPAMLNTGRWPDGKLWTFPFNKSVEVLYYNVDMFKAAGIDHPPATWDELAADAKKLTVPGKVVGWADAFDISTWEAFIKQAGGQVLNQDETAPVFLQPATTVMKFWRGLVDAGAAKQANVNYAYETLFGNQQSAMFMASIASLPFIEQAAGGKFQVGVAPLPAGPAGKAVQLYGTNLGIFKTTPAEEAAAWTFIKFAVAAQQNEAWVKATGYLPIRQSVTQALQGEGYFNTPEGKDKLVAIDEIPWSFPDDFAGWWDEAAWKDGSPVPAQIQAVLLKQVSPEQGMQVAFQRAQQIAQGGH